MERDTRVQQSLVEQILDETFRALEQRDGFDTHIIEKLKALAGRGRLGKARSVAEAVRANAGEQNETT